MDAELVQEMLQKGRVPAAPIMAALVRHVREHGGPSVLHGVSAESQIPYDTLETWLSNPERSAAMPFQTADALLCAIGMYWLWYGDDLRPIYEGVDLTWRKCACPGCEVWFKFTVAKDLRKRIDAKEWDPRAKKYCSKSCKESSWRIANGVTLSRKKAANRPGVCWRGHKIIGDNILLPTSGRQQCRECYNAAQRANRKRKTPEQRAANLRYQREWRQRKKLAA